MHLARRAPVAASNIEGDRHGPIPSSATPETVALCEAMQRDLPLRAPYLSCCGANVRRHGAVVGRCGRFRRNDVQQRWQRVVPDRHGGNFFRVSPWLTLLGRPWPRPRYPLTHPAWLGTLLASQLRRTGRDFAR